MNTELNLEYIEELSDLYPSWDCDPYEDSAEEVETPQN